MNKKVPWFTLGIADWIQAGKISLYTSSTFNVHSGSILSTRRLGSKYYELTDHLGNVLSTVMDRKSGYGDFTCKQINVNETSDYIKN